MIDPNDPASRIVAARDRLTAKLRELGRRENSVRNALAPIRYLANPWLHVAIAGLVGYRLGRPTNAIAATRARDETSVRAIVRAAAVAAAQALVRRAVVALIEPR